MRTTTTSPDNHRSHEHSNNRNMKLQFNKREKTNLICNSGGIEENHSNPKPPSRKAASMATVQLNRTTKALEASDEPFNATNATPCARTRKRAPIAQRMTCSSRENKHIYVHQQARMVGGRTWNEATALIDEKASHWIDRANAPLRNTDTTGVTAFSNCQIICHRGR